MKTPWLHIETGRRIVNEDSLQKKYEFALDYIRTLEARVEELEQEVEYLEEVYCPND